MFTFLRVNQTLFINYISFYIVQKRRKKLREYGTEMKSYNFLQIISPGYYLDAKDQSKWKVGQIKQMRKIGHKLTIEVMFDGYTHRYNQTYDFPSYSKLAPFRKHTLPYTGRQGQQSRRQQPSKTVQQLIKQLSIISSDLDALKSQQINQFIRGQLFIFIDYCLTKNDKLEGKYAFNDYMKLLFAYLDTFNKVLNKVFEFLKQVQKQGNLDQNYIYVHPKMAFLFSVTQFLFNCSSMVSKKDDRVHFHKVYGKLQSADSIYLAFQQEMKFLNLYYKCQKLMTFRTHNGKSLPWSIKKQAFILMRSLNPQQPFILPKDNKQAIQFLEYLPYFTQKRIISSGQEENYKIQLVFYLILSGNFEGKLIGINEMKKLISGTQYNLQRESVVTSNIQQKNLIGFLLDNNNFNSELFKRSLTLFQFAYRNKLFKRQQFHSILKLHKDKHELQLMNFYSNLAQFGVFLDESDAPWFFKLMIMELPLEENLIQLIKNYTTVVVDKNPAYKTIYMQAEELGFGLIYFWQQINNQNKTNKELIPKIIQGFATLLNNSYYTEQTERFIVSSIKGIKQMRNAESFLKVIHESLKLCKGPRMNKAIQLAERQINVVEAAMCMLKQQSSNLSKAAFQNLFQFLQEVNSISRKGLSPNDILYMWRMQKQKCRPHLLKFLRKFKPNPNQPKNLQRILSKSLNIQQIQLLIQTIFESNQLMQGYKQIDQQHYQTIDQLILCCLHNKGIIQYNYKHTIRYRKNGFFCEDDRMFLGMRFYLGCIENNNKKYQEVSMKATKRLIQIFSRPYRSQFGQHLTQVKVRNWLRVAKCLYLLKNNGLRSIQIQLQQIEGRVKSLNILQHEPLEIKVKLFGMNKIHNFVVPRYTSMWGLRLLIGQRLGLGQTNFQMQIVELRVSTSLEMQQDLSVAYIKTSKNIVSVLVHRSQEQHPHFRAIQKFKEGLSDAYGSAFFMNLSSEDPQNAQISLDVLFEVPFLKSMRNSTKNLQFKDWSQLIDNKNMNKLQYQLKLIEKIKDKKWINQFISKKGLKHLTQVILENIGKNRYKTLNLVMDFFIQVLKCLLNDPLPFGQQFLRSILIYQKQLTQDYLTYLFNCFTLIAQVSNMIKIKSLFETPNMNKILQTVLFSTRRSLIAPQLMQICDYSRLFINLNKHLRIFLNFQYLTNKMSCCRAFFEVLQFLIQRGELQLIQQPLEKLLLQARNSVIMEKSQTQMNQLIYGYLLCLYEFIKMGNKLQQIFASSSQEFLCYLLQECLFHPQNIALRKFKSKQLRELGFKFLQMLQFQTKNKNQINQLLIPLMSTGSWRKQQQWDIKAVQVVNKKFTGLKNLAATCYINSLLQQLFFIKSFSSQIMAVDSQKIDDRENVVREVQNIFGFLKYSQSLSYSTLSLCQNFILDGQPIDPKIQTDVDEFFHALMDKLQRNLGKVNKKQVINQVFRGQFSNLIIGQQCLHTSQKIQDFLSIRLQIKNKRTIYQALDQFIKGQILQGQNAYYCQKCNKKVKATKRVCLKDLPPVLIVTLKRLEFDFDTMQKFKLNTYCQFFQYVNFFPYTKQGLQQDSYANKQDYEYRLKGVVVHYGISEAGHYTSYVRTQGNQWNYFDDECISGFDVDNLGAQCFGGIEENPFGNDEDKKKSAYLLIYEKVNHSNGLKQVTQEVLVNSKVYRVVQQDNLKTKLVNILFEPNIQNYLFNTSEVNPKAFIIYYHTVFLRNALKSYNYGQFYNKCSYLIMRIRGISEWYLKQITSAFLLQFVIYGAYQVTFIVTSLICQAMKQCVDLQFIQQCVGLLNTKNIIPFVKIFSEAYFLHKQYAQFLDGINFSDVVLDQVKGKQIQGDNVINRVHSKKFTSEFGLPVSTFVQNKGFDPKDFLQAIQGSKISLTLQQAKILAVGIKNKRTLKALAAITVRKYLNLEQFKIIQSYLIDQLLNIELKAGEEIYYQFLIQLIQEMCKISDNQQQYRTYILAQLYLGAMRESLVGFKSQLMLFNGFFFMVLTNPVFKNAVVNLLNEKQNEKLVSSFKDWLKDLPNAIQNIRNGRWGWWKKPKKQYPGLTALQVEIQVKPKVKQALFMLDLIIQHHKLNKYSQFLQPNDLGYLEQKNGPQYVKIIRKIGFLVEIEDQQGIHKFMSEDVVVKKFL